jgi:hypothetical protein
MYFRGSKQYSVVFGLRGNLEVSSLYMWRRKAEEFQSLQSMTLTAKIDENGRENKLRNKVCTAHSIRVVRIR